MAIVDKLQEFLSQQYPKGMISFWFVQYAKQTTWKDGKKMLQQVLRNRSVTFLDEGEPDEQEQTEIAKQAEWEAPGAAHTRAYLAQFGIGDG